MNTAKEKVLAYFEEWAGKGINPSNGMAVRLVDIGYDSMQAYDLFAEDKWRVTGVLLDSPDGCFMWEIAARILKLDPPMAAPIFWKDWLVIRGRKVCYSACDTYMLEREQGGGVLAYYIGDDRRELVGSGSSGMDEEKLYNDCQAHKQELYNKLGGYNV